MVTITVACINNNNNPNNNYNNNNNRLQIKTEQRRTNHQVQPSSSNFSYGRETLQAIPVLLKQIPLTLILLATTSSCFSCVQAFDTYQCDFAKKTLICLADSPTYPCCFNPESAIRYQCTDRCGRHGTVFYQTPSTTRRIPTTSVTSKGFTTGVYTFAPEPSDGVKISAMLAILLPLSVVFIVIVIVCGIICVSWYRRRQRPATSGQSPEDIENRVNEFRNIASLNDPPAYNQTVTQQVLLPPTPVHDVPTSTPDDLPPSYELVTAGSTHPC